MTTNDCTTPQASIILGIACCLLLWVPCLAQLKGNNLVIRVQKSSSGPFGGQKAFTCLNLYSDGRLMYTHRSTSALGIKDEKGEVKHQESTANRIFTFTEQDSWQLDDFKEFLQSKAVWRLKPWFGPPHKAIDFLETSKVKLSLPTGAKKEIQTEEYYVASLTEKTKYPSALILLMDRIAQFENVVAERGTVVSQAIDCEF